MHRLARRAKILAMTLALSLALPGCSAVQMGASLPAEAVRGSGDPMRTTIQRNAYLFNTAGVLQAQPEAAARAVAGMEFLAAELPLAPRFAEFAPQVGFSLNAARPEWRGALGIAAEAPAQGVIDALYAMAAGGGAAALPVALFANPAETMARLAALPALPRTALAANSAQQELSRVDNVGRTSPGGDAGGGRGP